MATLYQRNGVWWAWGYDRNGNRWRRTTRQRDKRAAIAVAADFDRELALDADAPRDLKVTLADALDDTIARAREVGRSPRTIEFLDCKARHLVRLLGAGRQCAKITTDDVDGYLRERLAEGASLHTAQKEIRVLVQALGRAAHLLRYRPKVSPKELKPAEVKSGFYAPRERWLTVNEYQRLLDALNPNNIAQHNGDQDRRDYVVMWCQTGARASELYNATHADFDLAKRVWNLRSTKTAKRVESRVRRIPLSDAALEVVQRRWDREVLFPVWGRAVRDLYAACLRIESKDNPGFKHNRPKPSKRTAGPGPRKRKRVGDQVPPKCERVRPPKPFDPVSPNDFRRTFASWLAQDGVPHAHAAKLMGHASTQMLDLVYARLAPETLRSAIDRLPAAVSGARFTEQSNGGKRPRKGATNGKARTDKPDDVQTV